MNPIDKIRQTYQQQKAKMANVALDTVFKNPIHCIACGFGIGLLPAPGTFGTLFGLFIAWLIHPLPIVAYVVIVILLNLLGIWLCGRTNHDFGTEDHPAAVFDEIAAFPIVMIGIPFHWYYVLLGFVLFRFFDIFKPGPIGWIEKKVTGGVGVMLDDIAAALASLVILWIVFYFTGYHLSSLS